MKRFLFIAIFVAVIALVGLILYGLPSWTSIKSVNLTPQPTGEVRFTPTTNLSQATTTNQVIAQCRLLPKLTAVLSFDSGGMVEMLVNEGRTVKAGQPLARLGTRSQAQAAVASADQELLVAQQAEKDLQDGAFLATAQAIKNLNDAIVAIKDAKKHLDTVKKDDESDEIIAQADADLALARARQVDAQKKYDLLKDGADPNQTALARKRLVNAQAQLEVANQALADSELRAPFDGTVARLHLSSGSFVSPGIPVLSIGDFNSWIAETVDLTELNVLNVQPGAAVIVSIDALDGLTFPGVVREVVNYGETRQGDIVFPARIDIRTQDTRLRWNMTCSVAIQIP